MDAVHNTQPSIISLNPPESMPASKHSLLPPHQMKHYIHLTFEVLEKYKNGTQSDVNQFQVLPLSLSSFQGSSPNVNVIWVWYKLRPAFLTCFWHCPRLSVSFSKP